MFSIDFFPKFVDAAMTKKTTFGAVVSIVMIVTAAALCWSETWSYVRPPVKEQLVSVTDLRGALNELVISFNFTISIPCVLVHLDVFDIAGTPNDQARKTLFKTRVDAQGNLIRSHSVASTCGSCYGAETNERPCCKTCEDILSAYQLKGWGAQHLRTWSQCQEEGINFDGSERCRAYGSLNVNAIEGTFHLAPGINVINQFGHQHDISPFVDVLNLSHEIDHVTLGASLGESPLDHTRVVQTEPGQIHYRYNLKAVPTVHSHGGRTVRGFQYTVNFAEIPVTNRGRFGPGIFFSYTFAPVAVVSGPDRVSFAIFLARCVSIVGGTFMLGRLVDSFGYRLNTLEGKMRIGKGE
jgi:hypothetical protein